MKGTWIGGVIVMLTCLNAVLAGETSAESSNAAPKATAETPTPVKPVSVEEWTVVKGSIKKEKYKGKEAFCLSSSSKLTMARLNNVIFTDGTIELDIAVPTRGDYYIGVVFRVQDKIAEGAKVKDNSEQKFEYIYFRPFRSSTVNAIQYCAAGTKYNWEYLRTNHPGVYEAKAELPATDWFHARIEVAGETAKVFVNNAKEPNLVVKDLKHGKSTGGVGLYTYHKKAYFANVTFTPAVNKESKNTAKE